AGHFQYLPIVHPDIVEYAGQTMPSITASVQDDVSLGTDVTGISPKAGDPPNPAYSGKMWSRQDGTAFNVAAFGTGAAASTVVMTQKQDPAQYLTRLTAGSTTVGNVTTVDMTILNAASRYLGVYLQFFADAHPGTALTLTDIPEYTADTIISDHPKELDQADAMFVGVLGSVATVMAVPVWPAFMQPSFKLP